MGRIIVVLTCLLAGCASFTEKHSRTLLINRGNGEIKECTVDKWRSADSYRQYEDCIKDFEQQGYSIWNQY